MLNKITITISIMSLFVSILTLILGGGIYTKYKEGRNAYEQQQKEMQKNYLTLAEEYYLKGDYEKVAAVYSKDILVNNPYALLNKGVMYANGFYYVPNKEMAKEYFYKALKAGEKYYSIIYLLSILNASEDEDGIEEINRVFIKGCDYNNQFCEEVLHRIYIVEEIDKSAGISYIEDFNKKNNKEKREMLSNLYQEIGSYKQWYADKYKYYVDENGQVVTNVDHVVEKKYKVIAKKGLDHKYEMIFESEIAE